MRLGDIPVGDAETLLRFRKMMVETEWRVDIDDRTHTETTATIGRHHLGGVSIRVEEIQYDQRLGRRDFTKCAAITLTQVEMRELFNWLGKELHK